MKFDSNFLRRTFCSNTAAGAVWSAITLAFAVIVPPVKGAAVVVTIENLAPDKGNYLTPMWLGVHDGSFDLFNDGSEAGEALEHLAEDGVVTGVQDRFESSGAGSMDSVTSGGPIAPGASRTVRFELNPMAANRYLSFAAMVIPSNDAFISNDDPMAMEIFDESGEFVGGSMTVMGSQVWDAGTEVNDELPMNTAFFGQTTPNTGMTENGTVMPHPGYKAAGSGGILDDPMFASADFKGANYTVARITVAVTLRITHVMRDPNGVRIEWNGGAAPYTVQMKQHLSDPDWQDVMTTSELSAMVSATQPSAFVRVTGN